jgi:hypothetical protein
MMSTILSFSNPDQPVISSCGFTFSLRQPVRGALDVSTRHPTFLALIAFLLLGSLTVQAQNRVLFIGNSFTIGSGGGGVPGIFDRLAQAGGQPDPLTVMSAVGGQDFQFHSQDSATQAAIKSNPWTHVILQNYSTDPTHLALSGNGLADHYTYGTRLYEQIMTNNPNTRVILFETWSRAAAHSLITGTSSPSSFASTTEFQSELRTNYQGLADVLNATHPTNPPVTVAPVGTAWENAGGLRAASDPLFLPIFGSDNYHGNNNGYYLAACVFYSLIYGVSPHGLSTNTLVSSLNLGLTVSPTLLEDTAWSTVSGTSQTGIQAFLIDFGASTSLTVNGPAPGDPLNYWNNIPEAIGNAASGQLSNLVSTARTTTEIGLTMIHPFNGVNENGTTASMVFPLSATRDSLYGNTEPFNGQSNIFPAFKLSQLNPARTYTLTFFASRTGASDNRETGYTITGLTTGYATLNSANNSDATAVVPGMVPDASGSISVALSPTTNNNNAFHFTYLGAMRIDAVPQQEPIAFTRQPVSQTVTERQAASFTAAVNGTPPYFIQWLSNGVPIPNANLFTYVIPSVTTNMEGTAFSVVVSNLAFTATSTNAVLHITPASQNPAAQSLLFDFGGANLTTFGPTPDDPANYWNNITAAIGGSASASLNNLVTVENGPTSIALVMLSRFNGVNENGTLSSPWLPADATRDSLYGNTETFSGLANIFPSFKLTGLNPAAKYSLTFYASRTGVGDNRETGYTVTGANSGFAALNAANNVTNAATITGILPTTSREINVSLAPTANNNNANHFTYLGVLRVDAMLTPAQLSPAVIMGGQVKLNWTGPGQLQWAASILGPWTTITPAPTSPYSEAVLPDQDRFYRLVASP